MSRNLYMPLSQNEDSFQSSEEDPEEEYVSLYMPSCADTNLHI